MYLINWLASVYLLSVKSVGAKGHRIFGSFHLINLFSVINLFLFLMVDINCK